MEHWGTSGNPWGPLETTGGILEDHWGLLGDHWGILGDHWGLLEDNWGLLGVNWGEIGITSPEDPKRKHVKARELKYLVLKNIMNPVCVSELVQFQCDIILIFRPYLLYGMSN